MTNNWAVDLHDVRKTYGRSIRALDGVNIRAAPGEIFGLLGPNGAGKSTLVKIMMTVVQADRVEGTVLGRPVGHRRTMARIGYLPEAHRFPAYLTGRQLLDYYASLAGVRRSDRNRRAETLLQRVSMAEWADTKIAKYSKGMLQRLGIAQALMNEPDLVVLDEPTDGLDPIGRRDVRQLLLDIKAEGKTVFLNSHLLSELELVCDRVVILIGGKAAKEGRIEDLSQEKLETRIVADGDLASIRAELERLGGSLDGDTITLNHQDRRRLNETIDILRSRGHTIESVTPKRFSLEDIFVRAMDDKSGGVGALPVARPASKPLE